MFEKLLIVILTILCVNTFEQLFPSNNNISNDLKSVQPPGPIAIQLHFAESFELAGYWIERDPPVLALKLFRHIY